MVNTRRLRGRFVSFESSEVHGESIMLFEGDSNPYDEYFTINNFLLYQAFGFLDLDGWIPAMVDVTVYGTKVFFILVRRVRNQFQSRQGPRVR